MVIYYICFTMLGTVFERINRPGPMYVYYGADNWTEILWLYTLPRRDQLKTIRKL